MEVGKAQFHFDVNYPFYVCMLTRFGFGPTELPTFSLP